MRSYRTTANIQLQRESSRSGVLGFRIPAEDKDPHSGSFAPCVRQRHVGFSWRGGDANPTGTDAGRLGVTQWFLNAMRMCPQQLPWLFGWDRDPPLQPAVETCGKFIKYRNQKRCQKWVLESFLELLLALSYIFVPPRLPCAHPRGPVHAPFHPALPTQNSAGPGHPQTGPVPLCGDVPVHVVVP